jgi:drug/metabolite transporter (DMT)-like permease
MTSSATRTCPPPGLALALPWAVLFGAGTPFAKALVGVEHPALLAGLLCLGSGVGLTLWRLLRSPKDGPNRAGSPLRRSELPWLAGAVASGGVLGPVLLLLGLRATPAPAAALLLNLEGVLTALLAWYVFGEHFDRRIGLGMAAITAGGVLLCLPAHAAGGWPWGPLAIVAACLGWAVDNTFTRAVSVGDPFQVAAAKGFVAGLVNVDLALVDGARLPVLSYELAAAAVGWASLTLFVLALDDLAATARTGAYFSVAPYVGAAVSIVLFREWPSVALCGAAALMGLGMWLHLEQQREHRRAVPSPDPPLPIPALPATGPRWSGQPPSRAIRPAQDGLSEGTRP